MRNKVPLMLLNHEGTGGDSDHYFKMHVNVAEKVLCPLTSMLFTCVTFLVCSGIYDMCLIWHILSKTCLIKSTLVSTVI